MMLNASRKAWTHSSQSQGHLGNGPWSTLWVDRHSHLTFPMAPGLSRSRGPCNLLHALAWELENHMRTFDCSRALNLKSLVWQRRTKSHWRGSWIAQTETFILWPSKYARRGMLRIAGIDLHGNRPHLRTPWQALKLSANEPWKCCHSSGQSRECTDLRT